MVEYKYIQTSVKFRDFAELYLRFSFQKIPLKLNNFTDFKAFLAAVLTDSQWLIPVKSWKTRGSYRLYALKLASLTFKNL